MLGRVCLVFASLMLGVSCAPSPGCEAPIFSHPHPGHHARFEVSVSDPLMGEVTRSYLLHLPANYDTSNTAPVPLMLVRMTMLMTHDLNTLFRITTDGPETPMTRWSTCRGRMWPTLMTPPSLWSPPREWTTSLMDPTAGAAGMCQTLR